MTAAVDDGGALEDEHAAIATERPISGAFDDCDASLRDDEPEPTATGFVAVPQEAIDDGSDAEFWRMEILDSGKRYILRRGSGNTRDSDPGGATADLWLIDPERMEEYEHNRQRYHDGKAAAARRRAARAARGK